jgi:hypothetical protein
LGTYNTPGFAEGVAVAGRIAYVADYDAGLQVINTTNPRQPTLLGTYDTPDHASEVVVTGDHAYIADSNALEVLEVQRNRCRQFEARAVAQSLTIFSAAGSASLVRATLTCTGSVPTGTEIAYYLSPDNGAHWEAVTAGVEHVFTNVGSQLRWRAVLTTSDSVKTPTLTSLAITYAAQLPAPGLVSPNDGVTTNDNTPTFQWTAVSGANNYLLQVDRVVSFDSVSLHNYTVAGGSTSYTPAFALADGTWYWRVGANDSEGDLGFFAAPRSLRIDAFPPTWDQSPTDRMVEFGSGFRYDVNASDAVGIDHYWLNDTHFSVDGNGVITNASILPVGVYWLEVRAYDSFTYCTATFEVTMQDTQSPVWSQSPVNRIVEYGSGFRYDVNASDISGIDHYWVNGSTFVVDSAGVITNATALPVSIYWVELRAYDPYGHWCTATSR